MVPCAWRWARPRTNYNELMGLDIYVLNCFCVGVLVSFFKNLISITLTVESTIQHIQARNSPKTTH